MSPAIPAALAAAPAPVASAAQQEFTRLLRELFQLDQADLDFGIYRIMRARAADVEAFITTELPATLQAARQELATRGLDDVRTERDAARLTLNQQFGLDVASPEAVAAQESLLGAVPLFRDTLAAYRTAQTQLEATQLAEDLERTAYNDLYRFFARYYDSGDFVTQPRAGEAAYMMPYNGEEVKLYWANHDQYYIKTGENFRHYRFHVEQPNNADTRLTVEFELADADTTAGNNLSKKGRVFLPDTPADYFHFDPAARRLTLRFRFAVPTDDEATRWGTKQSVATGDKGVNERVLRDVAERIEATADAYLIAFGRSTTHQRGGAAVSALTYHLHRYTLPNHFDYFIHRNLGRFLRQELDYYLKHELLDLQFLSADWNRLAQQAALGQQLLRASVVRTVALRLITFLHELEEYQRALFEKKKLVVGAEYCISLDRLPATVRPAVLAHLHGPAPAAARQLAAWAALGMVPGTPAGTAALLDFLAAPAFAAEAAYARLPLDTEHLTQAQNPEAAALRDDILGAFDDLDGQTTGILINSENWQALNVLQGKYEGQIDCVYIDPPYNTGNDDFVYKDSYQSSSWLTLMEQVSTLGKALLSQSGSLFCSCDENEFLNLGSLLKTIFGGENYSETIIWNKRIPKNDKGVGNVHEYIHLFSKNAAARKQSELSYKMPKEGIEEIYEVVNKARQAKLTKHEAKLELRKFYKKQGYDRGITLYNELDPNFEIWGKINMSWPNPKSEGPRYEVINPVTKQPVPIPKNGWRWKEDTFRAAESNGPEYTLLDGSLVKGRIWYSNDTKTQPSSITYLKEVENFLLRSILSLKSDGSLELESLGLNGLVSYPKPSTLLERVVYSASSPKSIILDFFAGSGTTGHAVINLNREDEGERRFILVEMGEYFDTVTKPRVLKAAYSSTWQGGQAHAPTAGQSQLVQVLRLEQYEDTLNNMAFAAVPTDPGSPTQATFFADAPEERLRYVLARSAGVSRPTLGPAVLATPFAYDLDIVLANERRPVPVDLAVSFALLLGLHVERLRTVPGPTGQPYRLVQGHRRGRRHLCIWRTAPGHGLDEAAEDAALVAERAWVQAQPWHIEALATEAVIYCNATQLFGAEPAEAEFHRLLFNG